MNMINIGPGASVGKHYPATRRDLAMVLVDLRVASLQEHRPWFQPLGLTVHPDTWTEILVDDDPAYLHEIAGVPEDKPTFWDIPVTRAPWALRMGVVVRTAGRAAGDPADPAGGLDVICNFE